MAGRYQPGDICTCVQQLAIGGLSVSIPVSVQAEEQPGVYRCLTGMGYAVRRNEADLVLAVGAATVHVDPVTGVNTLVPVQT